MNITRFSQNIHYISKKTGKSAKILLEVSLIFSQQMVKRAIRIATFASFWIPLYHATFQDRLKDFSRTVVKVVIAPPAAALVILNQLIQLWGDFYPEREMNQTNEILQIFDYNGFDQLEDPLFS